MSEVDGSGDEPVKDLEDEIEDDVGIDPDELDELCAVDARC